MLHHALPRGEDPGGPLAALASTGWLGVSLFFVLSGFLLTLRYVPDGVLRGSRRDFWLERVVRLAPMYLLSMLFALPLFLRDIRVSGMDTGDALTVAVASLSLQQSWRPEWACEWNCPAWSLSVETWFYLAFPFLVLIFGDVVLRSKRRSAALLAVALGAPFVIFPWMEQLSTGWTLPVHSLSPLARWPEFVAGIALAGLVRRDPASGPPASGRLLMIGGVTWIAMAILAREVVERSGGHLLPIALPGFVLVQAGAWEMRAVASGPLSHPWLVRLGEASYALYLFHGPLHSYLLAVTNRVVGRGYDTTWPVFLVYLALAIPLALAAFSWLERPARGLLRARFGLRVARS